MKIQVKKSNAGRKPVSDKKVQVFSCGSDSVRKAIVKI